MAQSTETTKVLGWSTTGFLSPRYIGTPISGGLLTKDHLDILVYGSPLAAPTDLGNSNGSENFLKEWGGLFFHSEAEVKIAEALNQTGVLFFTNARGRVGLHENILSNG
jgi:hypothetical protein